MSLNNQGPAQGRSPPAQDQAPQMPKDFPPLTRKAYTYVMAKNYFLGECQQNPNALKMLEEVKNLHTIEIGELSFPTDILTIQIMNLEDYIATWLYTGSPTYARVVDSGNGQKYIEQYLFDDRDRVLYRYLVAIDPQQVQQAQSQAQPQDQGMPARKR